MAQGRQYLLLHGAQAEAAFAFIQTRETRLMLIDLGNQPVGDLDVVLRVAGMLGQLVARRVERA